MKVPPIGQLVRPDPRAGSKSLWTWRPHLKWTEDWEVEPDVHSEIEMSRRAAMLKGQSDSWDTVIGPDPPKLCGKPADVHLDAMPLDALWDSLELDALDAIS